MHINPAWRILTVGDGDLSFSCSLLKNYRPASLTATTFDDYNTLTNKYGDNHFKQLQAERCKVITGFDVTNNKTWGQLDRYQFDVVIFQFPLLPAFTSVKEFNEKCGTEDNKISVNTLHRRLLRQYLLNCFNAFLDNTGAQLAIITSKDVKPYREWNIEQSIILNTDINYLGFIPFNINAFPGYKIRNVDRDKYVKDTQGFSYIYSRRNTTELDNKLIKPNYSGERYCSFCRVGPFNNSQDKLNHIASKRHKQMEVFEQQWLADLKCTSVTK